MKIFSLFMILSYCEEIEDYINIFVSHRIIR